jgi:hypothetical protein
MAASAVSGAGEDGVAADVDVGASGVETGSGAVGGGAASDFLENNHMLRVASGGACACSEGHPTCCGRDVLSH